MDDTQENWHALTTEEIFKHLSSNEGGLTSKEARKRLEQFGFNEISPHKKKNIFLLFISQFKSPLIYILLLAALVTYVFQHTVDTWVILAVVIFNSFFGLLHELKAEKAMEALSKIMSLKTKVKRNQVLMDLPSSEIVPGDIIEISAGMKVPADLRIIEQQDLRVDESILTGESMLQEKSDEVLEPTTSLGDRGNMLFGGTIVVSGRGWGVIVNTGMSTEFGKIAKEVTQTPETKTPLQKRLEKFSSKYLMLILAAVTAIFVIGLIKGLGIVQMFLTALSAAISAIPEGLPAVITVALANGAYQMARRKAIVRKLTAVETLGSITVIASDKTGTLTHNQMTVQKIYLHQNAQNFQISGSGYGPQGEITPNPNQELIDFLKYSALCSDAEVFEENNEWQIKGDPTEGALITAATKAKIRKEEIDKVYPRFDEMPFETKKGFMATLNRDEEENNLIIVKGAPEKILEMADLDESQKQKVLEVLKDFSKNALRVIAIAVKQVSADKKKINEDDLKNLSFVGLLGMIDLPRKEAVAAINACRECGIKPLMITGDYSLTAHAVAKDLGLVTENDGVISGEELEKLSNEDFQKALKNFSVFARISPEIKLKIVEGLQGLGEIIAVIGDGINDAPALKKADIGVAMGEGGTDASREVADLVLADNNFVTIIAAIEEGRTIFQNIRRVIFYLLSTSAGELFIIFFSLIFLPPPFNLPLLPVQILWLNLVTDGTAGLSLALEPTHQGIIKYPPRNPKESIVNKLMFFRIILVGLVMFLGTMVLYSLEIKSGASVDRARAIAFTTMVIFQIFNVLNSRSLRESIFGMPFFGNKYILASMTLSFFLSYLTVALPFMRTIFHTVPLSGLDWLKIVIVGLSVIVVIELEKLFRRKQNVRY